jgi:thiamine biosynthesis lipoprotein
MKLVLASLLALLLVLTATLQIHGETYLSEEQAVKIALQGAAAVTVDTKQLTPAQRESLQRKTGLRFPEPLYKFFVGHNKDGTPNAYAVIMNEIGKEEFITFIVGMTPKGEVGDVAILEYRESRGSEVREKRFMRQFRGKKSTDPVRVNQDIINYTGATLSSEAIARGVKKALVLVQVFYLQK